MPDFPDPIDELTGFLARKPFLYRFEEELGKMKGGACSLSIAFLDIDHFLDINEQYGHAAGDAVLKSMADAIKAQMPENTLACRYGGDEFVLLFPNVEREQAFLWLENLRLKAAEMATPVSRDDRIIQGISFSAGIACAPLDGNLRSELMRKADQALYRAKMGGRGRVKLAADERMLPKTSHYTQTQLERLTRLAEERQAGEAELLREALDDLIAKYGVNEIER